MHNGWKIVPKFTGMNKNIADILLVENNGRVTQVARVAFPDDGQIIDNVKCTEEICISLRKRCKASV